MEREVLTAHDESRVNSCFALEYSSHLVEDILNSKNGDFLFPVNEDVNGYWPSPLIGTNTSLVAPSTSKRSLSKPIKPSIHSTSRPVVLDFLHPQTQLVPSQSFMEISALDAPLTHYHPPLPSPTMQPVYKHPKMFIPRVTGSPLTRAMILNTFHSYPYTLLPGHALAQFIHSSCFPPSSRLLTTPPHPQQIHHVLPQPLAICASIVQSFLTKTPTNSGFIWNTVRMAQCRLAADAASDSMSDWDVVAALQAVTIYLILRSSEDVDDGMDLDVQLFMTMMVSLPHSCTYADLPYGQGFNMIWER